MKNTKFLFAPAQAAALAIALSVAFALSVTFGLPAHAHNGEDHSDDGAGAPTSFTLAPRTEARSDDVEMLAVFEGGALTLYLSDFKTNAPIADAEVEIESGSERVVAQAVGDGVYKAATPWIAGAGTHALVVTVQAAQVADLLDASLTIPAPEAVAEDEGTRKFTSVGWMGSLGGVAALGLAAFGLTRRKSPNTK